jgi:glycosyltransferase involved in cell wall biosynthesis
MPAYKAGKVVASVIERIPPGVIDEIIAVDDASPDDTYAVLKGIPGVTVLRHEKNKGYGGAQVTLLDAAIASGADVAVLMHSDGGHFPEELPRMLAPILDGKASVVLGARIRGVIDDAAPIMGSRTLGALVNGPMPATRLMGHLVLTGVQNTAFGTHYDAWHSGYRAMTRDAMMRVNYRGFGEGYLFDTEFLLAAHLAGLKITEVPVSSFYDPRSGSTAEPYSYGIKVMAHVLKLRWQLLRQR